MNQWHDMTFEKPRLIFYINLIRPYSSIRRVDCCLDSLTLSLTFSGSLLVVFPLHSKKSLSQWQVKSMSFKEKFKLGYTKITCRVQVELISQLSCLLFKIYYAIKWCRNLARLIAISNLKWLSKFHTKYSNRNHVLSTDWKCSNYWSAPRLGRGNAVEV